MCFSGFRRLTNTLHFIGALALTVLPPVAGLAQNHLALAETASRSDNPDTLYPLEPDSGAYFVVHPQPRRGIEGPGVYAFGDACRGDVAHLAVYYQPNSRGRSLLTPTPARLLGARIHPAQPVTALDAWSSIRLYLSRACPSARALLLSRTYQPWSGLKKPLDPASIANIGRVSQRFAISLDRPDEDWREVEIGGAAPKTATEAVYYETMGKAHAFGRSCDDRVRTERNYCPQVLRPTEEEAHICTADDTFCLVIPQDWCRSLGGHIGDRKRACEGGGRVFTAMAEMFDLLRHDDSAELLPDGEARWVASTIGEIGRDILLAPSEDSPDILSDICAISDEPGDHLVVLNVFGFDPIVYGASREEIRTRRPDLVENAERLCAANYRCLSHAFRAESEDSLRVSSRGLRSKLCRSMEDGRLHQASTELLNFVSNAEDALGRLQSRSAARAWDAATRLARDYPGVPKISAAFVERKTQIAQALLSVMGVRADDVRMLMAQTRP